MAGARLADASNRVVATGVPMSAVPGVSRFWCAEAADGGRLLTWENFFLDRDTNTPVSAQLELMPSGDYIARTNLVERLYRRVNPDDWDDDGIQNDDDLDPYFYDGDNFGPHQELPQGANSNGGPALPAIRNVPAGTRISFTVSYEGCLASAALDDIVAEAYFDDNDPNVDQTTAENSCDYRHKFGVNERFNCNCWPSSANVSFSTGALSPVNGSQGVFLCPLYAVENPLAISYGGSSYTPNISVVEPSGIQVRNPVVIPYINSPGRAGWVGLRQEFYVLPMDVAFPQIAVQEVPSTPDCSERHCLSPQVRERGDARHTGKPLSKWSAGRSGQRSSTVKTIGS